MQMALTKGRPRKHERTMRKTSLAMPDELLDALREDALKSGFKHWSEQLRYEAMKLIGCDVVSWPGGLRTETMAQMSGEWAGPLEPPY